MTVKKKIQDSLAAMNVNPYHTASSCSNPYVNLKLPTRIKRHVGLESLWRQTVMEGGVVILTLSAGGARLGEADGHECSANPIPRLLVELGNTETALLQLLERIPHPENNRGLSVDTER